MLGLGKTRSPRPAAKGAEGTLGAIFVKGIILQIWGAFAIRLIAIPVVVGGFVPADGLTKTPSGDTAK